MARPISTYCASQQAFDELPLLLRCEVLSGLKEFCIAFLSAVSRADNIIARNALVDGLGSRIAKTAKGRKAAPLATSNVAISQRTKELIALGCLEAKPATFTVNGIPKSSTLYKILALKPLLDHLESKPDKSPAPRGRPNQGEIQIYKDSLSDKGVIDLGGGDVKPYSEGAFGLLGSQALTHSSKFAKPPMVTYHIKQGDYIKILTSTSTRPDAQIMRPSDQRVVYSLNGMLQRFRNNIQGDMFVDHYPTAIEDGYCFFDNYALTKEVGLKENISSNRERVLSMVTRLKDTTFSVDATMSEYWRKNFLPNGMTRGEYRYITEFYSTDDYYEAFPDNRGVYEVARSIPQRFFVVKFHPLIMRSMFDPASADSFIAHESLKTERLDIAHQLNSFVKPVVGVRDMGRPDNHHQYPLDVFHQRVAPGARLDLFVRDFFTLACRQTLRAREAPQPNCVPFKLTLDGKAVAEKEGGVFLLNGYFYKVEYNKALADELYRKKRFVSVDRRTEYPVVTVWRDRNDYLVGDNSNHAQATRRQAKELFGGNL